jgi:ATP phosphoribosyltransferase regulatory subunit
MMGVRADITPQTARMDAHSLRRQGVNRLCYASSVLYTRPRSPLASRSPIQVGVELYGESGLSADLEVISLMIDALTKSGVDDLCLDLGHVGIYRSLEEWLDLDEQRRGELFELLQSKSCDLAAWVIDNIVDEEAAAMVGCLAGLSGGVDIIDQARELFAEGPAEIELALDELQATVDAVTRINPGLAIYLDLCELEGYHYHTGIVFAGYSKSGRTLLANGGRYDDIGETFGRARPATGFSIDLKALAARVPAPGNTKQGIYVPYEHAEALAVDIARLRDEGERVVCALSDQAPDFDELGCDRQLIASAHGVVVKDIAER